MEQMKDFLVLNKKYLLISFIIMAAGLYFVISRIFYYYNNMTNAFMSGVTAVIWLMIIGNCIGDIIERANSFVVDNKKE